MLNYSHLFVIAGTFLLVAVPMFFIVKWILKKFGIGKKQNRKYIAIVPTLVLSLLLYVGIILLCIARIEYYPRQDFNRDLWDSDIEERYTMSKSIIDSDLLIGKSEEEVIEILGDKYLTYEENIMSYNLGYLPGVFVIEPDVLAICFEDSTVVEVEQHRNKCNGHLF